MPRSDDEGVRPYAEEERHGQRAYLPYPEGLRLIIPLSALFLVAMHRHGSSSCLVSGTIISQRDSRGV